MMNTNKTTLSTVATVRTWAGRPASLREAVVAWADRMVARWLRRSHARAVWRQHVRALNST